MKGFSELDAVMAVAKHKNFRIAAGELGLSPSALSHAIAGLESRLGIRIFHRTTRSVSLSEAGENFVSRIQPALKEISEAMESVNSYRETPAGRIRINTSEGAARFVLMPIVYEFMKRYPQVQMDIVTENRLIDIVNDGFDFGIRAQEDVAQDMIALPIGPKELSYAVVGSPSYFKGRKLPQAPMDLLNHECIRYRFKSGSIYQWEFERRGKELKVDVKGALTLDNEELALNAAIQGVGLAYKSEWSVREYLQSKKLIRVLEDWTPSYPALSLYYSSHRLQTAAIKAFIAVVKEMGREKK